MGVISDLFDKAIAMKKGQKMLIPAISLQQRESIRTAFYREKKKWKESISSTDDISISRIEIEKDGIKTPCLSITKIEDDITAIIIDNNGSIKKVNPKEEALGIDQESEKARIRKLMEEDGIPSDEIEEYFKEL